MSETMRPNAFRVGRSAWRYFWVGTALTVGLPMMIVAVKTLASDASLSLTAIVAFAAMALVWVIVAVILGATQKVTLLDPDRAEISLRGEPWIPVSHLTYGATVYMRGYMGIGIGTHPKNVVWISGAPLFGDSAAVRRWAHWLVQSSSIPSEAVGTPSHGESREDLLRVTAAWAA